MRRLAGQRLKALGYKTLQAASGPAALEVLSGPGAVDLVFADVAMPGGMSGFDLAHWIRQNKPALKIVLTTGFADNLAEPQGSEALDASLSVLRKPYSQAELAALLRETLRA